MCSDAQTTRARFNVVIHMNKLLFVIFAIFSQWAASHETGVKKYLGGSYSSNAFEYPASLTDEQVKTIVDQVASISDDQIFYVIERKDNFYEVVTCSEGARYWGKCKAGQSYLFGQGKVAFSNFSITSGSIKFVSLSEENIEGLEYSLGKYSNLPFMYSPKISKNQIEKIIEQVSKNTKHEILSVNSRVDDSTKYYIMTCSTGSRLKDYCDGGQSFQYDIKNEKIIATGNWVQ